ncbi:hypothetical protein [uncultured Arcobacter sp.]|uniref:hypothetical protein n=1 Tax=uncultured Arcobacter sp. TaxID=165434 RepID=UPI00262E27AA|nr:hypothetical protein [uncultured Arcobacter sp.]
MKNKFFTDEEMIGWGELITIKNLISNVYPNGIVSIVSDSFDFWKVVGEYLPTLKDDIMKRDGKVVIRPDSGDPVDIICGIDIPDFSEFITLDLVNDSDDGHLAELIKDDIRNDEDGFEHAGTVIGICRVNEKYFEYTVSIDYYIEDEWSSYPRNYINNMELSSIKEIKLTCQEKGLIQSLYDTFGGNKNSNGYIELDAHIGAIYGDSITLERCEKILERLKKKGFASTNIVFGVGSYTYQYNTRDTFGMAVKATNVTIGDEEQAIFKDPKTDNGVKKSAKGLLYVQKDEEGKIVVVDGVNRETEECSLNMLKTVFKDGKLIRDEKFSNIRERLRNV